ncbi:MAG: hypothetical protein HY094_03085 [Candidatus Melainabacteria bacterium]|nr:hypothetical protein [Candidatus Melainabacteria bacterium]
MTSSPVVGKVGLLFVAYISRGKPRSITLLHNKREEWAKKYDLKKLTNQQLHNLSQAIYCLKEKITNQKSNFFDYYSEMLKIPKRSKRLEIFSPEELTKIALEEFAPKLLEKFNT